MHTQTSSIHFLSPYSFQGQEHDDEVKGEGNSMNFKYRMHDSRVGRFFAVDPLAHRQPDQSPYKAFLNNPVIYTDPDGGTEFLTVIIRDEKTGASVRMSVPISDQIMTDGKKHMVGNMGCWHYENAFYDFSRVHTYTIKADGSVIHTGYTEIRKDRGVKDWDYVWTDGAQWGDKQSEPSPFEMKGGLYMTGSRGQGTKYYSKNAEDIGNVDALIDALGGLTSEGITKYNSKVSVVEVLETIKRINDFGDQWDNLVAPFKDLLESPAEDTKDIIAKVTTWYKDDDGSGWTGPFENEHFSSAEDLLKKYPDAKKVDNEFYTVQRGEVPPGQE